MEKITIKKQIMDLLAQGHTKKEIAEKLNISTHSVKAYLISLVRNHYIDNDIFRTK